MLHTILVVDDEQPVCESLEMILEDHYYVLVAKTGEQAMRILKKQAVDLVILDVSMPGMGGMETLHRIMELSKSRPEVVMLSATDSARLGVQAVKEGAFDYITKPFDSNDLLEVIRKAMAKRALEQEVHYLRSEMEKLGGFGNIIGKSPQMREVFRLVEKVSQTGSNVLIAGASGTGKELVARAIHSRGARRGEPFIPVNCAAIPQELLESEFFGHEKGSFTGAHERNIGKFELANKGILFLDEISTLRMELQAKLLRVLQEREFNRVGGPKLIRVDVQIIAATNMDLKNMVAHGAFREDLFYRLNVLPITLPPLKDRPGDIPLLVNHFLKDISYRVNRKIPKVTPEALKLLEAYSWPGNARELENVLERMVALSSGDGPIGIEDLPVEIATTEFSSNAQAGFSDSLLEARDRYEKMYVLSALRKTGWNQSEAARILRIHRNTLLKKMAAFQLSSQKEQQ
ncbi:MAG: sigma-54-dependent Fis family transcriptional regulator [Deltaproteobacteria bacterium]|nr:sigma-54-dependent Fis family transcriptional regulator [Deltaproteobacteria bacterium]